MNNLKRHQFIAVPIAAVLMASIAMIASVKEADSQVILFNNRTSFNAAATGLTLIDFNNQVISPATFIFYPGGTVTLSGVTFTSNASLFAVNPAFNGGYDLGDGTVLSFQGTNPSVLTVALPTNTKAVGFDFGAFAASNFSFTLSTGQSYILPGNATPSATPAFAGFVSSTSIAFLTLSSTDGGNQIDRFAFGRTAAVPEPGTVALLVTGGVTFSLALVRRRRR